MEDEECVMLQDDEYEPCFSDDEKEKQYYASKSRHFHWNFHSIKGKIQETKSLPENDLMRFRKMLLRGILFIFVCFKKANITSF